MNLTSTQIASLASKGVHVLDTKHTQHGTRHYIRTSDGRQMWTYDVLKFAERRLDAWREQRAQEIEAEREREMLDRMAVSGSAPFLSKAEVIEHIRRSVHAGEMTIRGAAKKYRIPESSLRRHLRAA
ncbi:helix-turn-helix domain-containing protein [Ralstonia pseudosolanacearum]|uniref:helix-turn-helix domain-containing protein n=1 Tax=Ralstonia pseudosolanacearum TaxID=1310165 RepID=UPI00048C2384|nr:helix-turn-helix domain-containing protein [Ralstonia pseudosolanacearum]MDO3579213.1 helix-turn-helix domain-containing protein [Ralstonia pseudosolanacearum]MDO3588986.1 helix-turn-helix domain-containing protein [Ralstonia pseudosolanacearum]